VAGSLRDERCFDQQSVCQFLKDEVPRIIWPICIAITLFILVACIYRWKHWSYYALSMFHNHHHHPSRYRPFTACSGSEILNSVNLFGHLVGLLGREISPTQGLYLHVTTQHRKTRTYIHAPSGIRTRDPIFRAVEDSTCLRPRGRWDRPLPTFLVY